MRTLTPRIAIELIAHEGIVREAYKDSAGVWTWSVGITNASGHTVHPRYKDRPQTLHHCLAVYLWLLEQRYLPHVVRAFGAHDPAEHELGAALSFHWNTGAIGRAAWLRRFLAGDREGARAAILDWARPAALLPRRRREQALFFDGVWTATTTAVVHDVAKPSYRPRGGRLVDIAPLVRTVLAAALKPAAPVVTDMPAAPARNWFERLFAPE